MSSVFIDQLDEALMTLLTGKIFVENDKGEKVPVPVTFHLPEGEGMPDMAGQSMVSLFQYDLLPDKGRLESDYTIDIGDLQGDAELTKPAMPFKVFYQIDLWSDWQGDVITMTHQLQALIPAFGTLIVPDSNGDDYGAFVELKHFKNGDTKLWDTGSKYSDQRFFRRIFRYCVNARLDTASIQRYKRVREVAIDADIKDKQDRGNQRG